MTAMMMSKIVVLNELLKNQVEIKYFFVLALSLYVIQLATFYLPNNHIFIHSLIECRKEQLWIVAILMFIISWVRTNNANAAISLQ